jgi:hypothetical protein
MLLYVLVVNSFFIRFALFSNFARDKLIRTANVSEVMQATNQL